MSVIALSILLSAKPDPFPIGDWQFWAATLIFLTAAWFLLRGLIPFKRRSRRTSRHKATLTIEGKVAAPTNAKKP